MVGQVMSPLPRLVISTDTKTDQQSARVGSPGGPGVVSSIVMFSMTGSQDLEINLNDTAEMSSTAIKLSHNLRLSSEKGALHG